MRFVSIFGGGLTPGSLSQKFDPGVSRGFAVNELLITASLGVSLLDCALCGHDGKGKGNDWGNGPGGL